MAAETSPERPRGSVDSRGFGEGFGEGWVGKAIYGAAIAFSAFQLWTAAYSPLESIVVRSVHVGFLMLLTFTLLSRHRKSRDWVFYLDWALGLVGFVLAFYHWIFQVSLIERSGTPNESDIIVGCIVVFLVFEAGRRVMGITLPAICAAFFAYCVFGNYLPSPLNHRGFGFDQVIDQMYLGTEGIYGIPIYVSSSYIFLFILFGSFLERAGMIRLFTDVALGTVGHHRGGPAKVAVIASALMGTINGSGVANVVTTGQFTIPLMKRFGYRPAFAGAVEATASMGGQIMPPVMGAVAFIMAETLNIAYIEVVKAAIVPALLYFATAFWMVHLEAGRAHLHGMSKADCPDALAAIRKNWYLVLPLAALVYLLFAGFTPLFAGLIGLALTVILILGTRVALGFGPIAMRVVFWIVVGIACSAFFRFGVGAILILVALLAGANWWAKGGRETLRLSLDSLAEGAKNALSVGIACALVGIIIGTMTLTGLATNFARVIVSVGEHSLFLSLILTMLTCLVLGMGIPTIPNYIITSSLAGPALLGLGVPLIVSHMFVFYFGIMADLTPPVALAAFAAAPIARESGMKIGVNAVKIAAAGFVVPFMAVYAPVLMLQDGGPVAQSMGYSVAVVYVVGKALIAIALWGAATIGYFFAPIGWIARLYATVAAFMLVAAIPATDEIGFVMSALFIGWQWRQARKRPAVGVAE